MGKMGAVYGVLSVRFSVVFLYWLLSYFYRFYRLLVCGFL